MQHSKPCKKRNPYRNAFQGLMLFLMLALCSCGKKTETVDTTEGIQTEINVPGYVDNETETGEPSPEKPIDAILDESTDVDNSVDKKSDVTEAVINDMTEEPTTVSIAMSGDILLHDRLANSGKTEEGTYDFTAIFEPTAELIRSMDLAMVNQEVIIGGSELGVSGYPCFNAPYELGDALADAGYDVILHATNHALDKGSRGLLNCLQFWREKYPQISVLGIHDSEEDRDTIFVTEINGITIAILNYTYGTNGIAMPEGMPYAVDLLDKERIAKDLARAGELAEFVIVCPHWGTEYTLEQTGEQEKWARFFAENGANLIIGTHPHVIEPVRWLYRDENGNWENSASVRDGEAGVLCYYSIGNFCNWTAGTKTGVANRMVGGIAEVSLSRSPEGAVVIDSYGVTPVVCHVEQGFGNCAVYPLEEYTEEMALRNEIIGQDATFTLQYCRELVQNVFGNLLKTDKKSPSINMRHGIQ